MSKKNSLLSFVEIVNLIVEPWTNNRYKEYETLYSKLKTNREKISVMVLSIYFQVPKISIRSTKILSEKCHVSISDIPNSLPQIIYNCLLRLIPVLSVKKDMTYTKVALMCASSLPISQLHYLFDVFLKYPEFHLAQSVYSILFERDPTLVDYLFDNLDKCENVLPYLFSSLSLPPFKNSSILKVASQFLSGKLLTTSSFFFSFCYYINQHLFPIDIETTDFFVLTLFQKLESYFAPHSHSFMFNLISESLNDYPLPFISIHLFFQDFNEIQIKSVFSSLLKGNGSIKSFFVLSQIISSQKLKELYSISTCTRFCTYTVMKKNIYFFKRSLEKITSLHFELRVLSKVLEIASMDEFQDVSFEFLEIFKQFTITASTTSDILKIFFTRDKKLIPDMVSRNADTKASILTSLYLLGNSPIVANPKLKTRFKSLTKALIPMIDLSDFKINCLIPKSLSTILNKKDLKNDDLTAFFFNLTVRQIRPAPFNVENAINIISLFQISADELGYKIRENPPVSPDVFEKIIPNRDALDKVGNKSENKSGEKLPPQSNSTDNAKLEPDKSGDEQLKTNIDETKAEPKEKLNETKKSANLVVHSEIIENVEPELNEKVSRKGSELSFQSNVIVSQEPLQENHPNLVDQSAMTPSAWNIIESTIQKEEEGVEYNEQTSVVFDQPPESKPPTRLVIESSMSTEQITGQVTSRTKTDVTTVISIAPLKSSQIEQEAINCVPIKKLNIPTQTIRNELKVSTKTESFERFQPSKKGSINICYDSNNNFEYSMLSDDTLSSSPTVDGLFDQDKQKAADSNKNNKNLKLNESSKDVSKSQGFSFFRALSSPAKSKSNVSNSPTPIPPSKAVKTPNTSLTKSSNDSSKKSQKPQSNDVVKPLPRPKSLSNMKAEAENDEEHVNISSDEIGIALPSGDYELSDSNKSYSMSGLSDMDENELNQMFGDDEQVQMFADMLLPPDDNM